MSLTEEIDTDSLKGFVLALEIVGALDGESWVVQMTALSTVLGSVLLHNQDKDAEWHDKFFEKLRATAEIAALSFEKDATGEHGNA